MQDSDVHECNDSVHVSVKGQVNVHEIQYSFKLFQWLYMK